MSESKVLYLGTDPTHYTTSKQVVHYPVIEMIPRDLSHFNIETKFTDLKEYTHLIFTSKTAVRVFMDAVNFYRLENTLRDQQWICIGASTEKVLASYNISDITVANEETQEGVIKVLDLLDLEKAYLFYPRSSRARETLSTYLKLRQLRHQVCDLYDTKTIDSDQRLDLRQFDEVVFTSPSTVEAFFEIYPKVFSNIKLTSIGPITQESLNRYIRK